METYLVIFLSQSELVRQRHEKKYSNFEVCISSEEFRYIATKSDNKCTEMFWISMDSRSWIFRSLASLFHATVCSYLWEGFTISFAPATNPEKVNKYFTMGR